VKSVGTDGGDPCRSANQIICSEARSITKGSLGGLTNGSFSRRSRMCGGSRFLEEARFFCCISLSSRSHPVKCDDEQSASRYKRLSTSPH